MTLKEFIEQYAQNLYTTLEDHGYSLNTAGFECCMCPMQAACEKSAELGDKRSCGEFLQQNLSDGKNFKA